MKTCSHLSFGLWLEYYILCYLAAIQSSAMSQVAAWQRLQFEPVMYIPMVWEGVTCCKWTSCQNSILPVAPSACHPPPLTLDSSHTLKSKSVMFVSGAIRSFISCIFQSCAIIQRKLSISESDAHSEWEDSPEFTIVAAVLQAAPDRAIHTVPFPGTRGIIQTVSQDWLRSFGYFGEGLQRVSLIWTRDFTHCTGRFLTAEESNSKPHAALRQVQLSWPNSSGICTQLATHLASN